jgi:hypothetical protein
VFVTGPLIPNMRCFIKYEFVDVKIARVLLNFKISSIPKIYNYHTNLYIKLPIYWG